MSEPVGNQPRQQPEDSGKLAIPGNSHKGRAADAEAETNEREPAEKMVEGTVITRKLPWWKRIATSLIADDAQNVGDYILTDVVIPSAKNLISDIVGQGINRMLFGSQARTRRMGYGGTSLRHTPYDRLSTGIDREPRRMMSHAARATHDFGEVVLETREEAVVVIDSMIDRISRYSSVTVSDLYDILGVTGSYVDRQWGWTDLVTADIRQVRGGFLLDLPRPEPIR